MFHPEIMALVARLFPDVRTHRQRQSKAYMLEAVSLLKTRPPSWLWDQEGACAGTFTAHTELLAELGRVRVECGDVDALEWADVLCRERPAVRRAVASMRAWRLRTR